MVEGRKAFRILTGTPVGKSPLRRPARIWEDNIRMVVKEIGIKTWVDLTQGRGYWRVLVNAALHFRVPLPMELASGNN